MKKVRLTIVLMIAGMIINGFTGFVMGTVLSVLIISFHNRTSAITENSINVKTNSVNQYTENLKQKTERMRGNRL